MRAGGLDSRAFRPPLRWLYRALQQNPKQFIKKKGALAHVRAANIRFADGVEWRAVFGLDEQRRTVHLVALGPHDVAYAQGKRRL